MLFNVAEKIACVFASQDQTLTDKTYISKLRTLILEMSCALCPLPKHIIIKLRAFYNPSPRKLK